MCEPIFDTVKPPFMKKLGFRKLQFGDAPIRIENIRVDRTRKEGVFMEMDFRWAGDPDIQLFVDAMGTCDIPEYHLLC
jgi:Ca2+-dependent lipid-binding protein